MGIVVSVPPFDVVIDSQGYILADQEEQKAAYGLTPVFVTRQNTQGDYGDNQQDFWLQYSQRDWSKGDGQKHQGRDDDSKARFYTGTNIDVTTPGEVAMRKDRTSLTFAAAPKAMAGDAQNDYVRAATSTTLYHVDYQGTITSDGAHGLGATPSRFGMTTYGAGTFMSTTAAGTVGVRLWNGAAFSTFSNSATTGKAADSLAYLNNSLYGFSTATGDLFRYDTSGVATVLYTWQGPTGGAATSLTSKLVPFGGKLLILRYAYPPRGAELWIYDGTSTAKLAEFPNNFVAYDCEVLNGTVFISGTFQKYRSNTLLYERPVIFAYKDGSQDMLWQAEDYVSSTGTANANAPALSTYNQGIVWWDAYWTQMVFYNPSTGATSNVMTQTDSGPALLATAGTFYVAASTGTTAAYLNPNRSGAAPSTAQVASSAIDFDTSLRKVFRGVAVEFDSAADGNGGSVDLSYNYNNVAAPSAYTSLSTGVTSGTEVAFPTPAEGTTHQAVSVMATLNKGTSTSGPLLKRLKVRAVPVQPGFKTRTYVLNLTGKDGDSPVQLRDGTFHILDGLQMATNLQTAAARTSPFTIKDHLDPSTGFTGVIEELSMVEVKPEQFVATVKVRQV